MNRWLFMATVAMVAAAFVGCTQTQQTQTRNSVQSGANAAYLDVAVRTKLAQVDVNSATAVRVAVNGSGVTLTGEAKSQAERLAYLSAARSVKGVTGVVDALTVNPQMRGIRGQASDAAIAARVAAAIAGQAGVNVVRVKPAVRSGVVTLSGTVPSAAIRQTVVAAARGVSGVDRVVDNLSISR
jgi:hyperosmotically inducible periplasmic protein